MKRKAFILISFLLMAGAVYGQNAKKYFKTGIEFVESGNHQDAIAQFTKALEINPEYTDAYLARAESYLAEKQLDKALEDCDRAKVFAPRDEQIFLLSGSIHLEMESYELALNDLNYATSVSKRSFEPYPLKAKSLLAMDLVEKALGAIDTALMIKKTDLQANFMKGVILERLRDYEEAERYYRRAYGKKGFIDPYIALARLKIRQEMLPEAFDFAQRAIKDDPQNTDAFHVRSEIYILQLDFPNAINDISKNIIIDPENPRWYIVRGGYYQKFNQHQYAINDFNKLISISSDNPDAYFMRAKSFEEILDYEAAIKDYDKIASLSEFDMRARKLLKEAQDRLYELNRETDLPVITLLDPEATEDLNLEIPGNKEEIVIKGQISDASELAYFTINGEEIHYEKDKGVYEFLASVDIEDIEAINIEVSDIYENIQDVDYKIIRTEVNLPVVELIAPAASDNGEIFLTSEDPSVYVEGFITDQSNIKSIQVEGLNASYRSEEMNPRFSATIDIMNKSKFTVIAEDIYGNVVEQDFTLNRSLASQDNPMGITWVIFLENSDYESFASLDGPTKDVSLMKMALAKYDVHNVLHKKDMAKQELEKFFSIDLRDLVRANHVNSLLVWYAGHGKFINNTGYWVPVDAQRDDEFTYFNINSLRASMQSYSQDLTHLLVITDACESGPTFYQAMRSIAEEKSCDDWTATKFKSSQVFSSAGYELAVDNSQFTRTFANTLANNPNACIPIENIVSQVTVAVTKNNQQKPKFGKIAGLEDENGTFFFILKDK